MSMSSHPVDAEDSVHYPDIIAVGSSTGGPRALESLLQGFSHPPNAAILIVQHIPAHFSASLAERLARRARFPVQEVRDGTVVEAGNCYLAPGGLHMQLAPSGRGGYLLRLRDTPPVNACKPAIDVLFDSIARHGESRVVAVILTGMGRDGCDGVRQLRQSKSLQGLRVLTQSEESCVVYGMPRSVVEAGLSDASPSLEMMAALVLDCLLELQSRKPSR